jgi:hypothetical protein
LTALIDALPREPASAIPSPTSAADLVALLPKGKTPNVRPSGSPLRATGLRQMPIVIGLNVFVLMMLIFFAISTLFSAGPEIGANPLAPRAADTTTAAPPKPGP